MIKTYDLNQIKTSKLEIIQHLRFRIRNLQQINTYIPDLETVVNASSMRRCKACDIRYTVSYVELFYALNIHIDCCSTCIDTNFDKTSKYPVEIVNFIRSIHDQELIAIQSKVLNYMDSTCRTPEINGEKIKPFNMRNTKHPNYNYIKSIHKPDFKTFIFNSSTFTSFVCKCINCQRYLPTDKLNLIVQASPLTHQTHITYTCKETKECDFISAVLP